MHVYIMNLCLCNLFAFSVALVAFITNGNTSKSIDVKYTCGNNDSNPLNVYKCGVSSNLVCADRNYFRCLSAFDGTRNQCVSFDVSDCLQAHCVDESDKAFCSLKSSFWELIPFSNNFTSDVSVVMSFNIKPLPTSLIQWLNQNNLSLVYSIKIFKKFSDGSISHLHILHSNFSFSQIVKQHTVKGILLDGESVDNSSTYHAKVDLFVQSIVNSLANDLIPVSSVVTDQFTVSFIPPIYISPQVQHFHVHHYLVNNQNAMQVEYHVMPNFFSVVKFVTIYYQCTRNMTSNNKCNSADVLTHVQAVTYQSKSLSSWMSSVIVVTGLHKNCEYQVWLGTTSNYNSSTSHVVTENNPIDFSVDIDLSSVKVTDTTVSFSWLVPSWAPAASNFSVTWISDVCQSVQNVSYNINTTRTVLTNLSPQTQVWFYVKACALNSCGPRSVYVSATTLGTAIPSLLYTNITVYNTTNIFMSWKLSSTALSAGVSMWRYRVYYDKHMSNLFCANLPSASAITTLSTSVVLEDLDACAVYSTRLQIIGPLGLGHLSDIQLIPTHYSTTAAPKSVSYRYPYRGNNTQLMLYWNAPCGIIFQPVKYIIRITDLYTTQSRDIYVDSSMDTQLNYLIKDLELGQIYRILVFTNSLTKVSSEPVIVSTDAFAGVSDFEILVKPNQNSGEDQFAVVFLQWIGNSFSMADSLFELFGHNDLESQFHLMNSTVEQHMRLRLPRGWHYTFKLRMVVHSDVRGFFTASRSIDLRHSSSPDLSATSVPVWMWPTLGLLCALLGALLLLAWRHRQLRAGVRDMLSSYTSGPQLLLDTAEQELEAEDELILA